MASPSLLLPEPDHGHCCPHAKAVRLEDEGLDPNVESKKGHEFSLGEIEARRLWQHLDAPKLNDRPRRQGTNRAYRVRPRRASRMGHGRSARPGHSLVRARSASAIRSRSVILAPTSSTCRLVISLTLAQSGRTQSASVKSERMPLSEPPKSRARRMKNSHFTAFPV